MWSGSNPVFSCVKRNRGGAETGLINIFNKEAKDNENFIWCWDGIPSEDYIVEITRLIYKNHKNIHYSTDNAYQSLKKKISVSFDPTSASYDAYASNLPNYQNIIKLK